MFERLKKFFGWKPPLVVLSSSGEGKVTTVVFGYKAQFLFPDTIPAYLEEVAREEARRIRRGEELRAKRVLFETQAAQLRAQNVPPIQKELNRREAARLGKEAENLRFSPKTGWCTAYDVAEYMHIEEIRALLRQGRVLLRMKQVILEQKSAKTKIRHLVRFGSRTFLIVETLGSHEPDFVTEALEQMNNDELGLLASLTG